MGSSELLGLMQAFTRPMSPCWFGGCILGGEGWGGHGSPMTLAEQQVEGCD